MKILFLVSIMLSSLLAGNPDNSIKPSNAETDIDGIYRKPGMYLSLEIKNDSCRLVYNSNTRKYKGVRAVVFNCHYKFVDDNLIELNSTPIKERLEKGAEIIQTYDPLVGDSIRVVFNIPHEYLREIRMKALNYRLGDDKNFSEKYKSEKFILSNPEVSNELMLPAWMRCIDIYSIVPSITTIPYDYYNFFLNYVCTVSWGYVVVKDRINTIDIRLPSLDNDFFYEHYIKGEYARVSGDSITWRGITFVKSVKNPVKPLDKDAFSPSFIKKK